MEVTIKLPKPHEKQASILAHPAKRKVVCAGRRAGKTTLAARVAVKKMFHGRRVLLSSTTQDQADAFWEKCKDWLHPAIGAGVVEKNETRRILQVPAAKGRIKVKTAYDADSLRGDFADFLVLDECAKLSEDAWDKVGAPMLLDNDGDAWFISTPRSRNWFFNLFQRAIADGERWAAWHFTSFDNPHLSQSALGEVTRDLTERGFQQEIMAEFIDDGGSVFRGILAAATAERQPRIDGHAYVMGCDWGKYNDYTVLTIIDATTHQMVALDRFNQIDYQLQLGRVQVLAERYQPDVIVAEKNSIGDPIIEQLYYTHGLPVQPFTTTNQSKAKVIDALSLAFERQTIRILNDASLIGELQAYEAERLPGGLLRYSAPEGLHDDQVISLALAWHGALWANPVE